MLKPTKLLHGKTVLKRPLTHLASKNASHESIIGGLLIGDARGGPLAFRQDQRPTINTLAIGPTPK